MKKPELTSLDETIAKIRKKNKVRSGWTSENFGIVIAVWYFRFQKENGQDADSDMEVDKPEAQEESDMESEEDEIDEKTGLNAFKFQIRTLF